MCVPLLVIDGKSVRVGRGRHLVCNVSGYQSLEEFGTKNYNP